MPGAPWYQESTWGLTSNMHQEKKSDMSDILHHNCHNRGPYATIYSILSLLKVQGIGNPLSRNIFHSMNAVFLYALKRSTWPSYPLTQNGAGQICGGCGLVRKCPCMSGVWSNNRVKLWQNSRIQKDLKIWHTLDRSDHRSQDAILTNWRYRLVVTITSGMWEKTQHIPRTGSWSTR